MIDKALLLKTRELSDQLVALQTPIRILDAINWDKQIKEEFLDRNVKKIHLSIVLIISSAI